MSGWGLPIVTTAVLLTACGLILRGMLIGRAASRMPRGSMDKAGQHTRAATWIFAGSVLALLNSVLGALWLAAR